MRTLNASVLSGPSTIVPGGSAVCHIVTERFSYRVCTPTTPLGLYTFVSMLCVVHVLSLIMLGMGSLFDSSEPSPVSQKVDLLYKPSCVGLLIDFDCKVSMPCPRRPLSCPCTPSLQPWSVKSKEPPGIGEHLPCSGFVVVQHLVLLQGGGLTFTDKLPKRPRKEISRSTNY